MARKPPASIWKKHFAAMLDPKILWGGLGAALITALPPATTWVSDRLNPPPTASTLSAPLPVTTVLHADLADVFPTISGFRGRLVLTGDRANGGAIIVTSLTTAIVRHGDGKPDVSGLMNQGSAPVASAVIIHGNQDRAYWTGEDGRCRQAASWPSNLLDAASPPVALHLGPGDQQVIRLEVLSELPGLYHAVVTLRWYDGKGAAQELTVSSGEWGAIGGSIDDSVFCHA